MRQGHPRGLYVLFFTEMWERFGFYTMAALFVLYMKDPENGYSFLQNNASQINGIYLGLVYFTPFFGGMLADQKLGYRWSIVLGAIVFAAGYFLLAIDSLVCFWAGLVFIVAGNGLFKPNISTLVGKLYTADDPRLDRAYNLFYMGINLGAFAAPWVAQYLRNTYGFHVGFAAAGVGMLLSLVFFLPFQKWLVFTRTEPAVPSGASSPTAEEVPAAVQRQRHLALVIIFAIVALFWMGFKQNTNTFQLWARDCTDRTPPEWLSGANLILDKQGKISTELFSSVNPFFVILFTPLVVAVWRWLRVRGKEPITPAKVGIGMALAVVAFLLLMVFGWAGGDAGAIRGSPYVGKAATYGALLDPVGGNFFHGLYESWVGSDVGRMTPWALIGAYAIITLGELCLSPMGLSLVSKLAAPRQRSAWMGGWFAATAVGGYLSGLIGGFWDSWPHSTFFAFLAGTSLFAGLLLLLFYRRLRDAMPTAKSPSA